jgi:hypothetical protein
MTKIFVLVEKKNRTTYFMCEAMRINFKEMQRISFVKVMMSDEYGNLIEVLIVFYRSRD